MNYSWDGALTLVVEVPGHVLGRSMSWGHTQWCSTLERPELKAKSYLGIGYLDNRVRLAVRALACLVTIVALLSLLQLLLMSALWNWSLVTTLCIGTVTLFVETLPYALALMRSFNLIFTLAQIGLGLDLFIKVVFGGLDFFSLSSTDSDTLKATQMVFLVATALVVGFLGPCLIWVCRRLRQLMVQEDQVSQVLLAVERPRRVLSVKPLALHLSTRRPKRLQAGDSLARANFHSHETVQDESWIDLSANSFT